MYSDQPKKINTKYINNTILPLSAFDKSSVLSARAPGIDAAAATEDDDASPIPNLT